jgi:hypothetical protein
VRNRDEGNVAMRQMDIDAVEIIGPERAVRATRLPIRPNMK